MSAILCADPNVPRMTRPHSDVKLGKWRIYRVVPRPELIPPEIAGD